MAVIKKIDLKLDDIMSVSGTTVKSPVDIANTIQTAAQSKGDTLDRAQIMVGALGTMESFLAAAKAYETKVPGMALTIAALEADRRTALRDIKDYGNVQNATIFSMLSNASALTSQIGTVAKNPYVAGGGLIASVTFSTAALLSKEGDTSLATGIVDFVVDTNNVLNSSATWQYGSSTWLTASAIYVVDKGTKTDIFSWFTSLGSDLKEGGLKILDSFSKFISDLFPSSEPKQLSPDQQIILNNMSIETGAIKGTIGADKTFEIEQNKSDNTSTSTIKTYDNANQQTPSQTQTNTYSNDGKSVSAKTLEQSDGTVIAQSSCKTEMAA